MPDGGRIASKLDAKRVWLVAVLAGCAGLVAFGAFRLAADDQPAIPRGISVVEDAVGDAVPATEVAAQALDRAPPGTDVRRVAVQSTGENLIVTFWHTEEIPSLDQPARLSWWAYFWDDGAPAGSAPHAALLVGDPRMEPPLARISVMFCGRESLASLLPCDQQVLGATVRIEGHAMRFEVPLQPLEEQGLTSPFDWAAASVVSPTPNTAQAWIDCVPACPPGFDLSPERLERARFDHEASER